MTEDITADWNTLVHQAPSTADLYLSYAIADIDKHLGKGYAAKHPELIAAYMKTAAIDFLSTSIGVAVQKLRYALQNSDYRE